MAYQRKTTDEYQIYGDYGQGFEEVTAAATYKEARQYRGDEGADGRKFVGADRQCDQDEGRDEDGDEGADDAEHDLMMGGDGHDPNGAAEREAKAQALTALLPAGSYDNHLLDNQRLVDDPLLGNPNLNPQVAVNYELGGKLDLADGHRALLLGGAAAASARAIHCAASWEIGGNTSSTSSNNRAALALPLRNTWAICRER